MTVSVIIPTLNGEQWLGELLSMLSKQTLKTSEILLVDSGSTDRTLAIARDHRLEPLQIEAGSFDHGGTRTMAAQKAGGDILVFLTQDAIPADHLALEKLVAPFFDEEKIAASYGRQLPSQDASPISAHLRLFNYPDQSYVRGWQDRLEHGFKTVFISNSFAAYRKQALAAVGYFPERQLFGEDSRALANLLEQGYLVSYVSDSQVYHSHNYTCLQDFKRYFDIGVFHTCECDMLEKFGTPAGTGKRFVQSEISFLLQQKKYILLPQSFLRNGLKFLAYSLGKKYTLLPPKIAQQLSMHRSWWKNH